MTDPVKASAALSGSHSIGNIRSTVAHDSANGAGFGGAGPVCIGSPGPMTAQPNIFDNHYFKEVRPSPQVGMLECVKYPAGQGHSMLVSGLPKVQREY